MDSFREKNDGVVSNRLSREQLGAEFSMRIRDLEPHVSQEENETVTAKAGLVEGTILSEAKETARPSNRRRKIRVYFPCGAQTHR